MAASSFRFRRPSILPGFWPAYTYTIFYLSLIVLIPLSSVLLKSFTTSWEKFRQTITTPQVVSAFEVSFGTSFAAGLISVVAGFLVAWVLVRYRFPGQALVEPSWPWPARRAREVAQHEPS